MEQLSSFRTARTKTLESFYHLLFPDNGRFYFPVIKITSPPLSGKTSLCTMLHNYIAERNQDCRVVTLSCSEMSENESVYDYFNRCNQSKGLSFDKFFRDGHQGVLLVDDGQETYEDHMFWKGYVKNTLEGIHPRIRIVIFTSFGEYNQWKARPGTYFDLHEDRTFRLYRREDKPGLQLLREELDEMVTGSVAEKVTEKIWALSLGHIGIARAIILFLVDKVKDNDSVSISELEQHLNSTELLKYIESNCRGIPSLSAFEAVLLKHQEQKPETLEKMRQYIDQVADGCKVSSKYPASAEAVDLLTSNGFLHEDSEGILHFASPVHLTIWLQSNRAASD